MFCLILFMLNSFHTGKPDCKQFLTYESINNFFLIIKTVCKILRNFTIPMLRTIEMTIDFNGQFWYIQILNIDCDVLFM